MLYGIFTIFVLLHGLAHIVYTALALNWIPLAQGQENWTGSSWLLTSQLGEQGTRGVGALIFGLLAALFVFTTIGLAIRAPWATTLLAISGILSSGILLIFWDGSFRSLSEKGVIGLVINIGLLVLLMVFHFPKI